MTVSVDLRIRRFSRVTESERKKAVCTGGMLAVTNGEVRLIATAFEWVEQIDKERAKRALERAEARLANSALSNEEREASMLAKRRALLRLSV